jgi:hypothetical protein
MPTSFVAHITGNPNITSLVQVNVRSDAGTGTGVNVIFQKPVGTRNLTILNVKTDLDNRSINGKVYQWFQLQFPEAAGWVRDDLISLEGDGSAFGYPGLTQATYAFSLVRQLNPAGVTAPSVTPTPTPGVTPPTVTPPSTPTPVPIVTPPSVEVTATVLGKSGLNLRDSANGPNPKNRRLAYQEVVTILGATPQAGTAYKWAQVRQTSGAVGWARTDFLSIKGDASGFGLSKGDEYPAPLHNYWWVRGQKDVLADGSIDDHLGWDFSANPGEPVLCGPKGGAVYRRLICTKCTPDKPNTFSQGITQINDKGVFSDPAWGYGFGNAVIVRYTNDLLPDSTKSRLAANGLAGAHLFVIYAHMSVLSVSDNQALTPFQQLGIIGNTGNSTALHLHVEVHASTNANDSRSLSQMAEFDPEVVFLR